MAALSNHDKSRVGQTPRSTHSQASDSTILGCTEILRLLVTAKYLRVFCFAFCLSFVFSGCATYPLGLSRQQWDALPQEKQAEYQASQYRIDEEKRQQAEATRIQQQEAAEQRARAEQARVEALYANARYGDLVTVTISGGTMERRANNKGPRRYAVEPAAFDLARGETKIIEIRGTSPSRAGAELNIEKLRASLSADGNNIILNDESPYDAHRVVLPNTGWDAGSRHVISFENSWGTRFSHIPVTIRLKALPGEPTRIIIDNH